MMAFQLHKLYSIEWQMAEWICWIGWYEEESCHGLLWGI